MSKKIDTAMRERDILRAKVEPLGWTLRGWNSLCDYSAWDKHGELVTIGPAVDGLICDNTALRARLAEVEAIITRVGADSEETHCGIGNEPCPTPTMKCHYCPRCIKYWQRLPKAEARVEKLERALRSIGEKKARTPLAQWMIREANAALATVKEGK